MRSCVGRWLKGKGRPRLRCPEAAQQRWHRPQTAAASADVGPRREHARPINNRPSCAHLAARTTATLCCPASSLPARAAWQLHPSPSTRQSQRRSAASAPHAEQGAPMAPPPPSAATPPSPPVPLHHPRFLRPRPPQLTPVPALKAQLVPPPQRPPEQGGPLTPPPRPPPRPPHASHGSGAH